MKNLLKTRRDALQALAAGATALALPQARAQAFPNHPLRMIVGFAPGGAADVMARIIASQELMKSAPDGYTLMMGTNTATVAVPALRNPPPYDPFKVFTPLSTAGEFSMFLAVSPSLPSRNLNEFLDQIAANPDKYNSGSSNSAAELAMLQLLGTRGAKVVNARY